MKKIIIAFTIITSISIFLRLYHYENRAWWYGDTARDIMVGYHIAKYHEFPLVGHVTGFLGNGPFYYPPYYYYAIAVVFLILQNNFLVSCFFVLLESLLAGTIFLIGSTTISFPVGLVAGIAVALSSHMIDTAHLWSAFVAPPLFYIGYLLFKQVRTHVKGLRLVGLFLMLLSGTIHFSMLIATGFVVATELFLERSNTRRMGMLLFVVFFIELLVFPLIHYFGVNMVYQHLAPSNNIRFQSNYFLLLAQSAKDIWGELFDKDQAVAALAIIPFILSLAIGLKGMYMFIRKNPALACFLFFLPFLGAIKNNKVDTYVYVGLYPALLLLFASLCVFDWEKFSGIRKIIAIGIISVFLCFLIHGFQTTTSGGSNMWEAKNITNYLYDDAKQTRAQNNFYIVAGGEDTNYMWESPVYWYYLETLYNRKIAYVINYGENLWQDIPPGARVYLICRDYSVRVYKDCRSLFERDRPAYLFIKKMDHPFNERYDMFQYLSKDNFLKSN